MQESVTPARHCYYSSCYRRPPGGPQRSFPGAPVVFARPKLSWSATAGEGMRRQHTRCACAILLLCAVSGMAPSSASQRHLPAAVNDAVDPIAVWPMQANSRAHRQLQQDGPEPGGSTCNCTGPQGPPMNPDHLLLIADHFGAMPTLRHYSYLFQRQLIAQGSQAVLTVATAQFNSPTDLTPINQLYPTYDYACLETRVGSSPPYFTAPPWALAPPGTPPPDLQELQDALLGLLNQGNVLVKSMPVLLAYRRDVLAAAGVAVPQTWDQMLQVAEALNGTDMNGDGEGDHALCVDVDPGCKLYWVFSSLAASMLQYQGTSSGYLVDPAAGASLLNTTGMQQAFDMWSRLMQYNSPEQATKAYCGVWEDAFTEGRCLFTLGAEQVSSHTLWADGQLSPPGPPPNSNPNPKPYSWGRTGIAPTPGSTTVYSRAAGVMVTCDAQTCPYATPLLVQQAAAAARGPGTGAGKGQQQAAAAGPGQGMGAGKGQQQTVYVNRAPVVMRNDNQQADTRSAKVTTQVLNGFSQAWMLSITSWVFCAFDPTFLADPALRTADGLEGVELRGDFNVSYFNSTEFVRDVYSWINFLRAQGATGWVDSASDATSDNASFVPPAGPYLGVAEFAGLEAREASDHLRAAVYSLLHPNAVPDPQETLKQRVYAMWPQMVSPLRITLANAVAQSMQGVDPELVESDLAYKLGLWAREPATVWSLSGYYQDIGYVPPPPPSSPPVPPLFAVPPPDAASPDSMSAGLVAGIVVAVTVVSLLLLATLLLMLRTRSKSGFDAFGKVRAAGLGPSTSLVVTDIQSSTSLWELLPAGVMEQAVRCHHEVMRATMHEHKAYETCTEGDSFIIAFHTPLDALRYCLAVQTALLSVPWPEALLLAPEAASDAAEVRLEHRAGAMDWCNARSSSHAHLHLTLAPSQRGGFGACVLAWLRGGPRPLHMPAPTDGGTSSMPNTPQGGAGSSNSRSSSHNGTARPSNSPSHHSHLMGVLQRLGYGSDQDTGTPRALGVGEGMFTRRTSQYLEHTTYPAPASGGSALFSGDDPTVVGLRMTEDAAGDASVKGGVMASAAQQRPDSPAPVKAGYTLEAWLAAMVHPAISGQADASVAADPCAPSGATRTVKTVALRGLRVRMGLHAGLTDPQAWAVNKATGRWCASGPFLSTCKTVGDAGAGGMIVLSRDFWTALLQYGLPPDTVVLHMGEHQLKDHEGSQALYLALPAQLVSRLAVLPPLRSLELVSPSIFSAALGRAAVVFMHAVGVGMLRAWDAELTRDSLQIYHETVSRALLEWGGYLMELVDGLCLASFADAGAAVGWALSAQAELMTQDWDPRVLRNQLCEEVSVMVRGPAPLAQQGLAAIAPLPRLPSITSMQGSVVRRRANTLDPASSAAPAPVAATAQLSEPLGHLGPASLARLAAFDPSAVGRPLLSAAAEQPASLEPAIGPEAVAVSLAAERPSAGGALHKRVLMRGLRIKAGIDVGEVLASVNPSTGRMGYWGKVMNRSARISGHAASNQVLCSSQAWSASCSSALPRLAELPILGVSLGQHALKGITDRVTIVHCTLDPEPQERGSDE